jgi:deoxyribonuclease-1/deoxyribonuclease-1-like protein
MKLRKKLASLALSSILVLSPLAKADSIKIANWNLGIFGAKKASDPNLLKDYAEIIKGYDIFFVQEIRNKDQTAFQKLHALLPGYGGIVSSMVGRKNPKEQYGVFYKPPVKIIEFIDFNPDPNNQWERPPIKITWNINNYQLTIYNIHTDPDTASEEIGNLEKLVLKDKNRNIIVLGDLNADCGYYNPKKENRFSSWLWAIDDEQDTTVSSTNCAFDRIILDKDAKKEYKESGVYKEITKDLSDHYLVWACLETTSRFDHNKDGIVNFKDFAISPPKDFKELSRFASNWIYSP